LPGVFLEKLEKLLLNLEKSHKKIRQIISFHLALQASEVFDGCIELDESYFPVCAKVQEDEVRLGK
jgi:hypothetical protein